MFQSPVADSQQTVVKGYEIEWMNESIYSETMIKPDYYTRIREEK